MAAIDLFAPYALGRLELRNRFVRSATTSAWADERGIVGPEIVARYRELARGGVGLIVKGHLYVDPRGKAHAGMAGASDDAHIPGLAQVTDAVHANGGVIVAQINHGGCEAEAGERMGPSALVTEEWRARAMDAGEIEDVVFELTAPGGFLSVDGVSLDPSMPATREPAVAWGTHRLSAGSPPARV